MSDGLNFGRDEEDFVNQFKDKIDESVLREKFAAIDQNKDGIATTAEFIAYSQNNALLADLAAIDADGDRHITADEIVSKLAGFSELDGRTMTKAEVLEELGLEEDANFLQEVVCEALENPLVFEDVKDTLREYVVDSIPNTKGKDCGPLIS